METVFMMQPFLQKTGFQTTCSSRLIPSGLRLKSSADASPAGMYPLHQLPTRGRLKKRITA
ncbi:hypothetical protein MCC93_12960 [Morococcus cerebrosus]|uniref:Uncharacterized protein n=1 Tax=Morococcus cerebrosus TaxID=1056807 RepID=A0A0C1GMZ6_9NEIS|nr:hypothetical protein MCC93_12960 [Morococcus cerebrosus]